MFDIFKKSDDGPRDVKGLRDAFLRFIKQELQKVEGGEGRHIKALQIFIDCQDEEKHLYESAVYFEENHIFKNEIQRIADDFAIDLPDSWTLDISFVDAFPEETIKMKGLDAALFIQTRKHTIKKSSTAYLRVLSGEAEKEQYVLTSGAEKYTIGREHRVQVEGGFFRINTIAFPGDKNNECNKFISRQHAHIKWDEDTSCFMLFADEGGIPPGNKLKVRSEVDETLERLNSTQIGHRLREGDQIILGESATLQFSYLQDRD